MMVRGCWPLLPEAPSLRHGWGSFYFCICNFCSLLLTHLILSIQTSFTLGLSLPMRPRELVSAVTDANQAARWKPALLPFPCLFSGDQRSYVQTSESPKSQQKTHLTICDHTWSPHPPLGSGSQDWASPEGHLCRGIQKQGQQARRRRGCDKFIGAQRQPALAISASLPTPIPTFQFSWFC